MHKLAALSVILLVLFLAVAQPVAGADGECAVKLSDWQLERIRKDRSGANRMIAAFRVTNVSRGPVTDFRSRMIYYEAMGKKLRASRWKSIRRIEPGKSQPTRISEAFVPLFGSYEIEVRYQQEGQTRTFKFLGSSPYSEPNVAVGKLVANQSWPLVVGHTARHFPAYRKARVAVRLKNFGALEATGVTLHLRFLDDKGRTRPAVAKPRDTLVRLDHHRVGAEIVGVEE